MTRTKAMVTVRRDNKGRVLPQGISQRKDGRYILRITHNGIAYSPIYSWDLEELKKTATIMRGRLEMGDFDKPSSITLNQYFEYRMETYKKGEMKEASYQNDLNYWKWYVGDSIGKRPIQKIKRNDLVNLYKRLQERKNPLAWSTITRLNSLVFNVMDEARLDSIITRNPAEKVLSITPKLSDEKEREALSMQQTAIFLDYIGNHRFFRYHKRLFTVLLGTGMRVGECCALCDEDLDFEESYLSIHKTLYYRNVDGEGRKKRIGGTKSKSGTRTIPMLEQVKEALEEQLQWKKEIKLKCSEPVETLHETGEVAELKEQYRTFVFLTQNGTAYTPDYVTQIIKKVIASYNKEEKRKAKQEKREPVLLEDFSSHYLRHTFATRAAELGVALEHIAKWLGHAEYAAGEGKQKKVSRVTKGYIHLKWEEGWKSLTEDVEILNQMRVA